MITDKETGNLLELATPVTSLLSKYYREGPTKPKWYIEPKKRGRKKIPLKSLAQCSTKEDLERLATAYDPFYNKDKHPVINYYGVCTAMSEDYISTAELSILLYLCQNITAWNIWYGSIKTIIQDTNISSTHVYRAIDSLITKGYIRQNISYYSIHPWYVWKGDYLRQDLALQAWCSK